LAAAVRLNSLTPSSCFHEFLAFQALFLLSCFK
jgi:hypothetical protein